MCFVVDEGYVGFEGSVYVMWGLGIVLLVVGGEGCSDGFCDFGIGLYCYQFDVGLCCCCGSGSVVEIGCDVGYGVDDEIYVVCKGIYVIQVVYGWIGFGVVDVVEVWFEFDYVVVGCGQVD